MDEDYDNALKRLEDISANIFNAILIGSQLFDDQDIILKFVDELSFAY